MDVDLERTNATGNGSPAPELLWRMQGPARVVAAALYKRPAGTELRVFFEPEENGDLLSSQFEERPNGVKVLVRRANRLRSALRDQGWVVLPLPAADGAAPPGNGAIGRFFKAGVIGLGLVAVAGWGWHRSSKKKAAVEQPPQNGE